MRDPYRARPDFGRYGVIAIVGLVAILAVLVAVYLFRPANTATEKQAADALSAQMDSAQEASDQRNAAARAEQTRDMQ